MPLPDIGSWFADVLAQAMAMPWWPSGSKLAAGDHKRVPSRKAVIVLFVFVVLVIAANAILIVFN